MDYSTDTIAKTAAKKLDRVFLLIGFPSVLLVLGAFIAWYQGTAFNDSKLFVLASALLVVGVSLFAVGLVKTIKIDKWEAQQKTNKVN